MKRVDKSRMKETSNDSPGSFRWVVVGGPFYLKTEKGLRRITSKDGPFYATPEQVPESFRDSVKLVDPEEEKKIAPKEVIHNIPQLRIISRGETGFYDILDQNGKRQNEQNLTEVQAVELMDKLQSTGV